MNINCNRSVSLELFQTLRRIACAWLPMVSPRRFLGAFLFSLIGAQAQAVTNVSGSISADTTWTASSGPYVLRGAINVVSGVTLTIEPGTVIKGYTASRLYVYGTLRAQGTAALPITFTSTQDDSVGGDTNNDGNATAPSVIDWSGLHFLNARIYEVFPFLCPICGGQMRLIAFVTEGSASIGD